MKFFLVILLLLTAPAIHAADWVDLGDGTWSCSVGAMVTTTQVKNMLEQNRAWDNFRFRYVEDQLDASTWLSNLLVGFEDTQHPQPLYDESGVQIGTYNNTVYEWYQQLWTGFVHHWVPASSTNSLADGLAVSVPSPPADPAPPSP